MRRGTDCRRMGQPGITTKEKPRLETGAENRCNSRTTGGVADYPCCPCYLCCPYYLCCRFSRYVPGEPAARSAERVGLRVAVAARQDVPADAEQVRSVCPGDCRFAAVR